MKLWEEERIKCAYPRCSAYTAETWSQFCPSHAKKDNEASLRSIDDRTKELKAQLYKEQKGRCNYCGQKFIDMLLVWEHMTPVTRFGSNAVGNLQLACQTCNGKKYIRTDREFRADNKANLPQQPRTPAKPSIRGERLRGVNLNKLRESYL